MREIELNKYILPDLLTNPYSLLEWKQGLDNHLSEVHEVMLIADDIYVVRSEGVGYAIRSGGKEIFKGKDLEKFLATLW